MDWSWVRVAKNMCEKNDCQLLYLTKFGSHLYGMNDQNSDLDFKGLFLPSLESCLMHEKIRHLKYNTGDDSSKNSSEDVDISLWSIQYFLELIRKGETNAIDLLYSPSNPDCAMFMEPLLKFLFNDPLSYFNPKKTNAFLGYAIGQAKKYGIKGSRLGVLKNVYQWLDTVMNRNSNTISPSHRLGYVVDLLLDNFYDSSFCFHKKINGEDALVLCGKVHLYSIKLEEFYNRIKKEYEKYGDRAHKAEQNEGIDWKAISHAMRCIVQMHELLMNGEIRYPLKHANYLYEIKQGKYTFKSVESALTKGINMIEGLQEKSNVKGNFKRSQALFLVESLYEKFHPNTI